MVCAGLLTTAPHGIGKPFNCDSGGFKPGAGWVVSRTGRADSSDPEVLAVLGERVRKSKSQLGVAFDGDGDRVSFLLTRKGVKCLNDVMLCLFASDLLKRQKNQKSRV